MRIFFTVVFVCVIFCAWGQPTGPGGVGNASTNVLWLSADNGAYTNAAGTTPANNGNNVALWADRSANGRHATQATAGLQPNYITNVINGRPVIRFTAGNNDQLLSTGVATGNTASVFTVARWSSLPSSNPGIIQASPAGLAFSTAAANKVIGMWVSSGGGNALWGRTVESDNTAIDIPPVTPTSVNTFYSFMNLYNGSTGSQYVNNALAGSAAYDGTLKSWSDFGIGRQADESWNGDIAEVIVYNVAVNAAQRIIINNYLAAKYNLTLSVNDVYTQDNNGFDYDVAGIGSSGGGIHNDARGSGILRIFNPTNLGNNEFFIWGHDNGNLQASVTSGLPTGVTARFARIWRVSESNGVSSVNVGGIDMEFDLSGLPDFAGLPTCDVALMLRLLVDTNNDNIFSNDAPIIGATHVGGGIYRFENVTAIGDGMRFTLAITTPPLNTGPAGVGSADGTSSLKLWFRPDNGVNTTGTAINSWSNSAGIAALDISETGGQRPTLVAGAVNGFNAISFSGSNRLRTGLTLTTSNFVTNQASSFVVSSADNTTQQSCVYLTDPLDVNRFSNHIPWAGIVYYDIGDCCGTDARLDVGGLANLNTYSIWSYDAEPATGKQLYRNGTQLLTRPLTSTYSSHATHRFNIGGNTTGAAGFQGDVTEVIIFKEKINTAERILIQNYLAAKYGLTLSANDVYTQDNPARNFDFDVAGIGRVNSTNIHNDSRGTGIVRVFDPSNLNDNEFFIWGHNNASTSLVNYTDVPVGVQGRLERVWSVSEPADVGSVDIQFDLTEFLPITASDLRLLIDHDGDGIFGDVGTIVVPGAIALACNQYLFENVAGASITDGDRFTIGSSNITQTPLPIELESFTGRMVEGSANLEWTTLTETNNQFFTVERSVNGKNFTAIGQVPGSGTSKEKHDYEFMDGFPPFGISYYRLKQTDYDGAHSYSDVIRLENIPKESQLIAIPNPVAAGDVLKLRIKHTENVDLRYVDIRVFDVVGKELRLTVVPDGQNNLEVRFEEGRNMTGIFIITATSPDLSRPLVTRVIRK